MAPKTVRRRLGEQAPAWAARLAEAAAMKAMAGKTLGPWRRLVAPLALGELVVGRRRPGCHGSLEAEAGGRPDRGAPLSARTLRFLRLLPKSCRCPNRLCEGPAPHSWWPGPGGCRRPRHPTLTPRYRSAPARRAYALSCGRTPSFRGQNAEGPQKSLLAEHTEGTSTPREAPITCSRRSRIRSRTPV